MRNMKNMRRNTMTRHTGTYIFLVILVATILISYAAFSFLDSRAQSLRNELQLLDMRRAQLQQDNAGLKELVNELNQTLTEEFENYLSLNSELEELTNQQMNPPSPPPSAPVVTVSPPPRTTRAS
jgi:type II secretory pathway pseudopilin PulG